MGDRTRNVREYDTKDDAPVMRVRQNDRQPKGATMRVYMDENIDSDRNEAKNTHESKISENSNTDTNCVSSGNSSIDDYGKLSRDKSENITKKIDKSK